MYVSASPSYVYVHEYIFELLRSHPQECERSLPVAGDGVDNDCDEVIDDENCTESDLGGYFYKTNYFVLSTYLAYLWFLFEPTS